MRMYTTEGMMIQTSHCNIVAPLGVNIEGASIPALVPIPKEGLSNTQVIDLRGPGASFHEIAESDLTVPEGTDPITQLFMLELANRAEELYKDRKSSTLDVKSRTTVYVRTDDATIYTDTSSKDISPKIKQTPREDERLNNNVSNNSFSNSSFNTASSSSNTQVINITGNNQTIYGHVGQRIEVTEEGVIWSTSNTANPLSFTRGGQNSGPNTTARPQWKK